MTISVIKAYQEDFDRVLPLLMEFDASRLGPTEWHRIFTSIWKSDIDYVGYMLVDEGNVVGFYGLLFSDHTIGGQRYTLCNFGNWIIKDGYRGHAIAMLLPLLRLTNITITNISASSNVRQIFQKLGFKEIRRKWLVLCPFFSSDRNIFFQAINLLSKLKDDCLVKCYRSTGIIVNCLVAPIFYLPLGGNRFMCWLLRLRASTSHLLGSIISGIQISSSWVTEKL